MNVVSRLCAHGAVALAPLLFLQGRYARSRIVALPEAPGPREGLVGEHGPVTDLLLLGESTVAGVGVPDHDAGLAGCTARSLSGATGTRVRWRVHAANGLTAAALSASLDTMTAATRADVVVIGLGANDVFRLHGPARWRRDLGALVRRIRERFGAAPVLLSAVPPVGRFPGLPQPLRAVLGMRARLLDYSQRRFASGQSGVWRVDLDFAPDPDLFCADGIHPSRRCYRLWGEAVAAAAAGLAAESAMTRRHGDATGS